MSDDLTDRLREVTGGKLDCTNTPNSLRLAAADRIEELEAKLARVKDDVLTSVGEAFAGMSHEHASPYTRAKIKEAIDRVFIGL